MPRASRDTSRARGTKVLLLIPKPNQPLRGRQRLAKLALFTKRLSCLLHRVSSWRGHFGSGQHENGLGRTVRAHKLYFVGFALPVYQHDGTHSTIGQAALRMRLLQLDDV